MPSEPLSDLTGISSVGDNYLFYIVPEAGTQNSCTRLQILTALTPASGTGNNITLTATAAFSGSNDNGGNVILTAGGGDGTGNGGNIVLTAGFDANDTGGSCIVFSDTSGGSNDVYMNSGGGVLVFSPTDTSFCQINLQPLTTTSIISLIQLNSDASTVTGGSIDLVGDSFGSYGMTISSYTESPTDVGPPLNITAGASQSGSNANGGSVNITAGSGDGSGGLGGNIVLQTGINANLFRNFEAGSAIVFKDASGNSGSDIYAQQTFGTLYLQPEGSQSNPAQLENSFIGLGAGNGTEVQIQLSVLNADNTTGSITLIQLIDTEGFFIDTSTGATIGNGPNITLSCGSAPSGSNGDGGNVILIPGTADGTGTAGAIELLGPVQVNSSVGTSGQVFTSGGPGVAPSWGSAGGGGLVLLEVHTASNSTELNFTSWYSTSYDTYIIEFVNILPATNNVSLNILCSTNNGSSYDTDNNYSYQFNLAYNITTVMANGGINQTAFTIIGNISNSTVQGGVSGRLELIDTSTTYKIFTGQNTSNNNGVGLLQSSISGWYQNTTIVNALQILMSSGNIASGTIRIYGLSN